MKRQIVLIGVAGALGASLLGTALVANAQDAGGQTTPQAPAGEGLQVKPHTRFGTFLDSQTRFRNDEGDIVTVTTVAGTVVSTTENSIELDLEDGSGIQTFVFADPVPTHVQRALEALEPGDKAAVTSVDGEPKAIRGPGLHKPRPHKRPQLDKGRRIGPNDTPGRPRRIGPPDRFGGDLDELRERLEQRLEGLSEDIPDELRQRLQERIDKILERLNQGDGGQPSDDGDGETDQQSAVEA